MMLRVIFPVHERIKAGALTLDTISGVGMLSVGIIGASFLGNIQDRQIDHDLSEQNPEVYEQLVGEEKFNILGKYNAIEQEKIPDLDQVEQTALAGIMADAKKNALMTVTIFPAIMLVCYLILIFYFRSKGGYKVVELIRLIL